MASLPYTNDLEANELLGTDPTALVVGLLLHQQVPTEWAYGGPLRIQQRLGHLDPARIAAMDPERLAAVFSETPAVHRFPAAMAKRVLALSDYIMNELDGNIESLWVAPESAQALRKDIEKLPGFGTYKARILVGILAKQYGVRPDGWESEQPDWPSIADVETFDDVLTLKERKAAWKASKS